MQVMYIILKNLAGHTQVDKINKHIFTQVMILWLLLVAGGHYSQTMWLEVQHKQNFAVTMAGSGLTSAQKKRLQFSANKQPCIIKGINNMLVSNNSQTCK